MNIVQAYVLKVLGQREVSVRSNDASFAFGIVGIKNYVIEFNLVGNLILYGTEEYIVDVSLLGKVIGLSYHY